MFLPKEKLELVWALIEFLSISLSCSKEISQFNQLKKFLSLHEFKQFFPLHFVWFCHPKINTFSVNCVIILFIFMLLNVMNRASINILLRLWFLLEFYVNRNDFIWKSIEEMLTFILCSKRWWCFNFDIFFIVFRSSEFRQKSEKGFLFNN